MSTIRSDFQIGETYVEYLGFRGKDEYQKRIEEREELCRRNNLNIIRVFTEDLLSLEILQRKFGKFKPPSEETDA